MRFSFTSITFQDFSRFHRIKYDRNIDKMKLKRFSNDLPLISVLTETLMSVLYFESLPSQSFFHQVSPPVYHFGFPRLFRFFFLILLSKIDKYKQKQNIKGLRKSGHSSQRIYSCKHNIYLFVKIPMLKY